MYLDVKTGEKEQIRYLEANKQQARYELSLEVKMHKQRYGRHL